MQSIQRYTTFFLSLLTATFMLASVAAAETVEVKNKDGVGYYLVDGKGMTLYLFKKDSQGKSVCGAADGCLDRWPIFYGDRIETSGGVSPGAFGTITRNDGKKQTTFKGMPLYYFSNDATPGDTNGQGINTVWHIATP